MQQQTSKYCSSDCFCSEDADPGEILPTRSTATAVQSVEYTVVLTSYASYIIQL